MDNQACPKIIGKACFKAYPSFSRRAIAYRLLHLLIPSDIRKILPKKLSDPLIAPGVEIPLNAKFPPGTCIVPGCSFPAGWDPDQEPPECAKSAPLPTLAMMAAGGNPPSYLTPGPSGPLPVPPPQQPPPSGPWFYDKFDGADVDWSVWTSSNLYSGTNTIDTDRLKQYGPTFLARARIETAEDTTIPPTFDLTFDLEYDTDLGGHFRIDIYSGVHQVFVQFDAPDTIKVYLATGWTQWTIASFLNTSDSWRLSYDGTLISLYRNSSAIFTDQAPCEDTWAKGKIYVETVGGTIFIDELKIEEQ